MEKFYKKMGQAMIMVLGIFLMSIFSGIVMYFIYPNSIQLMFPNAVKNGILAETLPFWTCVKICWLFGILVKHAPYRPIEVTDNSKKEKI